MYALSNPMQPQSNQQTHQNSSEPIGFQDNCYGDIEMLLLEKAKEKSLLTATTKLDEQFQSLEKKIDSLSQLRIPKNENLLDY